jgi:hypothetical protein
VRLKNNSPGLYGTGEAICVGLTDGGGRDRAINLVAELGWFIPLRLGAIDYAGVRGVFFCGWLELASAGGGWSCNDF